MKIVDVCKDGKPYCSSGRRGKWPAYVVLHYSGTPGASGRALAERFAREYIEENDRQSSAHYVVDGGTVYVAVPERLAAWHVGDGKPVRSYLGYRHARAWHAGHPGFCGNRDSIGIELACDKSDLGSRRATDPDWTISGETLRTAAELCAEICARRDIPVSHVLRHWDATGKPCPRPLVSIPADCDNIRDDRWEAFLSVVEDKLRRRSGVPGGDDARTEA